MKRLPEENQALLKYLIGFFVRSHGTDEQSIATTFAPLLMRENATSEPTDAALLRSVTMMRMLLSAYQEIFEVGSVRLYRRSCSPFSADCRLFLAAVRGRRVIQGAQP